MSTEVRVPEVSENVTEGKVISVLVAVGDHIELDQSLIELETDKAVVAIPSPAAGEVLAMEAEEGQVIKVGDLILSLTGDSESTAPVEAVPTAKESEVPTPSDAKLDAPPVMAMDAPEAPAPEKIADVPPPATEHSAARAELEDIVPAAPSVRRLARQLGADIRKVSGSGPGGRISQEDVKLFVKTSLAGGGVSAGPGGESARALPDFSRWGPVRREALSRVREVTADAMSYAWRTIPQVTQYDQADVTEVEAFRREFNSGREEVSLSMSVILLKVAAAALRAFPRFASSLDAERRELIFKDYLHIGVAVDTEHGLLVPVLRDVDAKGLRALATELAELAGRARERRVTPAELEGGVFTLSNLGGIGGTNFSPIVYSPQVAILGVSRSRHEAVWIDGAFAPRLMLPLSLSYDHRVIDGADAARFLAWMVKALEQPLALLLD